MEKELLIKKKMLKLKNIITLDDRIDFELESLRRGSSYNSGFADVHAFLYMFYPQAKHTPEQMEKIKEFSSLTDKRFREDEHPNHYPGYAPGDAMLALRNELLMKWLGRETKPYIKIEENDRKRFQNIFSKAQKTLSQKTTAENLGEQLAIFYNVACAPKAKEYFNLGIKILNDSIDLVKESISTIEMPNPNYFPHVDKKADLIEKLSAFLITPYANHLNIDEKFNDAAISSLSIDNPINKENGEYKRINWKIENYFKMAKDLFSNSQKDKLNEILENRIIKNLESYKTKENISGNNFTQCIELMKEFNCEPKQEIMREIKNLAFLKEDRKVIKYLGKICELGYNKILTKAKKDIDWAYLNPSTNLSESVCFALDTLLEFDDGFLRFSGLSDREVSKALEHLEKHPRNYSGKHRELLKSDLEKRAKNSEGINLILSYRDFLFSGIYDDGKTVILGPKELSNKENNLLKYISSAGKVKKAIVFTGKISRDSYKEDESEAKKTLLFFTALNIADYTTKKSGKIILASCGCADRSSIDGIKYNFGAEIKPVKHGLEGKEMLNMLNYKSDYYCLNEIKNN